MTKKESPKIWAKKIVEWLNSEEGKKALEESMKQADEAITELRKALQIDDWLTFLHTPVGPADGSGIWPHQCA
ncbi:MAG: hypothetical protein CO003_00710 [Candidatus Portnoybacteria bacterium CG_4_8_14_3_um_filter_44_15]|uniref:Uncharacterized protein n=1 Tax=Candidatus Portnoybacteria bacterium CG_4_8_14_3_um_filter_44_15 TaxID=1974803 RepID=A0A2M7IE75_9BACT|nr:MAG: hypothetical protein CO003_00710 [Candidatus Portnoybacteria bacterium CG_4_8_14_3_um_filter_44_15]